MSFYWNLSKHERITANKKWIYRQHIFIYEHLEKPLTMWSFIIASIIQVCILVFTPEPNNDLYDRVKYYLPVIIILVTILIFLIIETVFRIFIAIETRKTGANYIIPEDQQLTLGIQNRLKITLPNKSFPWIVNAIPSSGTPDKFKTLKKDVFERHNETYLGTVYGGDLGTIQSQIGSHIDLNGKSVLGIIEDGDGNKLKGFTFAFPVNFFDWYRFTNGEISDKELYPDLVVQPAGTQIESRPFGIIIVCLVLPMKDDKRKELPNFKGSLLTEALAFHLKAICDESFVGINRVPAAFKTTNPNILRFIKKYKINGNYRSVWIIKIKNMGYFCMQGACVTF